MSDRERSDTNKMMCSECGVELNHHADKLVDPVTPEEAAEVDAALGCFVLKTYCCPECGGVESRRVSWVESRTRESANASIQRVARRAVPSSSGAQPTFAFRSRSCR